MADQATGNSTVVWKEASGAADGNGGELSYFHSLHHDGSRIAGIVNRGREEQLVHAVDAVVGAVAEVGAAGRHLREA